MRVPRIVLVALIEQAEAERSLSHGEFCSSECRNGSSHVKEDKLIRIAKRILEDRSQRSEYRN